MYHRRLKFALRTLMVAILVVSVVLSWCAANRSALLVEERLLQELSAGNAQIMETDSSTQPHCSAGIDGYARRQPTSALSRMGRVFDPRLFERITELELNSPKFDDNSLLRIGEFPHLARVSGDNTLITSTGLTEFKNLHPNIDVTITIRTHDPDDPFGF